MSKPVPQFANPYLLSLGLLTEDLGSNLPDVGQNRVRRKASLSGLITGYLKINFNLENPGLNVYNVNEYIAKTLDSRRKTQYL